MLLNTLKKEGPQRWLLRKLQRYGVSIYQRDPSSPKGYRLESARLFDDIAELAGGGVELDVEVEVIDE